MLSDSISVKSHLRSYDVFFAEHREEILRELAEPKSFVIADPVAMALLGPSVRDLVGPERLFLLTPSEESKTMDRVQDLLSWLIQAKVRKDCRLVALGGGVIQDLTGFTASILYRGIDWIFVPTTLLAQADSCIGSKTSINVGGAKNIVGNFYPPAHVLLYLAFLDSLPEVEVRSGIGEILHFMVYAGSPLLEPMIEEYDRLLEERGRLRVYIAESLRIKKGVIECDEFDRGERNKFNYGHTFGHALEAITHFEIRHGQAVTVGMDLANYVSNRMGLLAADEDLQLHRLLRVNFPDYTWADLDLELYETFLRKDKKNVDDDLSCILCEGIGALTRRKIPIDQELRSVIGEYFASGVNRGQPSR